MSRFSKPRKSFNPSTRKMGEQSLERQVLTSQTTRDISGSSNNWTWKDTYYNENKVVYIPSDPIILSEPFCVTIYEQVDLFVSEDGIEKRYYVLNENGEPEAYVFWTDNEIGTESFYVLGEDGEPEEFQTYD